jgi:hypothetical protein
MTNDGATGDLVMHNLPHLHQTISQITMRLRFCRRLVRTCNEQESEKNLKFSMSKKFFRNLSSRHDLALASNQEQELPEVHFHMDLDKTSLQCKFFSI